MPGESKAVFLSYASEDLAAAQRIAEVLRAAGIEVWLDQSELRGGDAWDAMIRGKIRGCALFVALISAHTRTRAEGYFRFEWKLAVDRSYHIASDRPFLLPIAIDETGEADARVPDRFREVQWT
ncbi:MAG: toll/interleukin-1 receptor domain-containing protein [Steroidobacteraceae bacterium]